MSGISAWLLSIAGVVILSVLCEFILPEGQINRYTRVIFSFVTLFVIISPLPTLFGKEIDFSKWFTTSDTTLQENYLYNINKNKLNAIQEDLQSELTRLGINNVEISITANLYGEELEILKIYVDLRDIEFSDNFENKNTIGAKNAIEEIISLFPSLQDVEIEYKDG